MESLSVPSSHLELLHRALIDMKVDADTLKTRQSGGLIPLTRDELLHIRWNVVTYLDMLEALTSAWWHHVADRRMIEEQFRFLVDKTQQYTLLKDLREAAGGTRAFPSLDAFVKRLEELENPPVAPPGGVLGKLWPWPSSTGS
jgi:hypothetical protein